MGLSGSETKAARLRSTRLELVLLLAALAAGKAVVIVSVYLANEVPNFLYLMSTRWDANWFLTTAVYGYLNKDAYAFSPFYPTLIRAFSPIIGIDWVTALAIANVLSFIVPVVLYKTFGFRAALLFELFPTYLFYTTIPYSEGLVLLFLALSVLVALRGRLIASSASISLAIFGWYTMVFALPSFLIAFLRRWRWRTIAFYVLPLLTGVLILGWFQASSGSYWIYFQVEKAHWHVALATPWEQVAWLLPRPHAGLWPVPGNWVTRNLPFEVFYIFGAVWLLKTKVQGRAFLAAYSFSTIIPLFFVIGGPAESIPRLLLPAFPVFAAYATFVKGRYLWVYCAVCVLLTVWAAMAQTLNFFA